MAEVAIATAPNMDLPVSPDQNSDRKRNRRELSPLFDDVVRALKIGAGERRTLLAEEVRSILQEAFGGHRSFESNPHIFSLMADAVEREYKDTHKVSIHRYREKEDDGTRRWKTMLIVAPL